MAIVTLHIGCCQKEFSREVFDKQEFIAVAFNEPMLNIVYEGANDEKPQTAPALFGDIAFGVNARLLVNREVLWRTVENRDFQTILKTLRAHFDFRPRGIVIAQGMVSMLDDVGAGFVYRHFDFADFLAGKSATRGGFVYHVADVRQ